MWSRVNIIAASLALVATVAASPLLAQTGVAARTLTVGATPAPPDGTRVRLDGLGTSGGTNVLFSDAEGDIFERLLGKSDLPAAVGYTDEAETWSQLQTFSSGGTSLSAWLLSSTVPQLRWYESDQGANERQWIALANDKAWMLRAYTDDAGSSTPILTALRGTGTAVTSLTLTPRVVIGEHLYPTTGYTSDLASPSAKMRTLNAGELFIETIVAQERITTMGGRFTVTPSNVLTRDINTSTTTVCVKYPSFLLYVGGVEAGSKIWFEKAGQFEVMLVDSSTTPTVDGTYGDYCYTVTRNADGSGANSWTAGDGIIDTGKTGSGMIDQFAVRGLTSSTIEGPSIDFLTRTSGTWNALSPRVSIGNLNGRYGISTDTWGMAAGDPAGANLLAVSDSVRLRHGTTDVLELDGSTGDITASGDILLSTGGSVTSTGNYALGASGLNFAQSSGSSGDTIRSVNWTGGGSIFSYLAGGSTPTLAAGSVDVLVTATNTLDLRGYMSSFPVGLKLSNNLIEITGGVSDTPVLRPDGDNEWTLGAPSYRFKNIHLNLGTAITNGTNVVVIDPTDTTRFKQMAGWSGTCSAASFTVQGGIITSC